MRFIKLKMIIPNVIKLIMWGSLTTNMFQTYARLTGKDIGNEILRTYGITGNENGDSLTEILMEPRQCTHRKPMNPWLSSAIPADGPLQKMQLNPKTMFMIAY